MLNKKSLKIILSLIFYSVLANAQNGIDSVYFFSQDQKLIENLLFSPTFSTNTSIKSYGFLKLDFNHEKGGFRRAQEAYNTKAPQFLAKGFNVLGNFRIAGSFEFNNSTEDSLANGQKNNLEDFTTFYPHANKSGTYKRQNYVAKASLSYSILKNYLVSFINLDYYKHQSSGTVDPRLSSNRFIFKIKPGININFMKQSLGLYGIFGKADERVSLGYKNENFKTSSLYPDRIHYMSYGYGSEKIKDTSNVYKYDNYKGFGIQYAINIKKWSLLFSSEYQLFENKNYNQVKTVPGGAPLIATFTLNTIAGSLFLTNSKNKITNHQITLDYDYNEGYDGNLKTSGSLNKVNYRVNALNVNASYLFLWDKDKKKSKEIGFNISYNQSDKQDLAQADGLKYEQIKIGLNTAFYQNIDHKSKFKFSLSPYYILPLSTELKYNPNSMSEFIRNVVFTDYYYFNSKVLGTAIFAEYISSKLIKNQQFGFYCQLDYSKQLKQELRQDLNPTFVPNGYRSILNLGINMYL